MFLNVNLYNHSTGQLEYCTYIPIDDWIYDVFESDDELIEIFDEMAQNYVDEKEFTGYCDWEEIEMEELE